MHNTSKVPFTPTHSSKGIHPKLIMNRFFVRLNRKRRKTAKTMKRTQENQLVSVILGFKSIVASARFGRRAALAHGFGSVQWNSDQKQDHSQFANTQQYHKLYHLFANKFAT